MEIKILMFKVRVFKLNYKNTGFYKFCFNFFLINTCLCTVLIIYEKKYRLYVYCYTILKLHQKRS